MSELRVPLALNGLRLGKSSWHGKTRRFVSPLEWLFYGGQRGSPEKPMERRIVTRSRAVREGMRASRESPAVGRNCELRGYDVEHWEVSAQEPQSLN